MTDLLDPSTRRTARRLACWFMPDVPGFPSAVELDPDDEILKLIVAQMQPHWSAIAACLDAAAARSADDYLPQLRERDPGAYELLRTLLTGWYLSCRPVWDALGYTGRKKAFIDESELVFSLRDDLLDGPRRRGPVWRKAPT